MVNGRYLMAPSPIPKFDNPKMHMNPPLQLFGAGREKRIYAVPPYTRVESLGFEDHPFEVQRWDCRLRPVRRDRQLPRRGHHRRPGQAACTSAPTLTTARSARLPPGGNGLSSKERAHEADRWTLRDATEATTCRRCWRCTRNPAFDDGQGARACPRPGDICCPVLAPTRDYRLLFVACRRRRCRCGGQLCPAGDAQPRPHGARRRPSSRTWWWPEPTARARALAAR